MVDSPCPSGSYFLGGALPSERSVMRRGLLKYGLATAMLIGQSLTGADAAATRPISPEALSLSLHVREACKRRASGGRDRQPELLRGLGDPARTRKSARSAVRAGPARGRR